MAEQGETGRLWLYHHLTVSGLPADVEAFVAAARGPGIVPWRLDYDRIEEDLFHLAATQPAALRTVSIDGCRTLARQFRERVEARQARALRRPEQSQACPFDLQTLLPIPEDMLARGPTDPTAVAWLGTHWGIPDAPRHIVRLPRPTIGRRLPAGHSVEGWGFFTRDASPAPAIEQLAARWPSVCLRLRVIAN